ncbi:MAG: hypothetical protein AVDCRST_MAG30-4328 [uncultured Solirubrobacteraceae bacterium]|uniref:DUF559 domain-containing protein n=1 Tax=uncultured Solirubrobacteraceae bacterium TaxID=1162706 RepID=A0A6J4U2Y7_9ACTN|nr:MAG: hypothetical protein AVDCRST_MAG30-4328 [uncultured Solirubrobacteraceae bacterium]
MRAQLLDAGLTSRQIERRLASGHLHALHRGVYAVGHTALPPFAHELAALLACGPTAHLSHRTAAVVWRMLPPAPGPIHVTISGSHRRGPATVHLHRTTRPEVTHREDLPLTSAVRTLTDLTATGSPELDRAVNEALVLRLVSAADIRHLVPQGPAPTRSEAERRLLALIAKARLPRPRTNVRLAGHEVDAHWPDQRLVVEVDGYAFHGTRAAFERDRARDADLLAAGQRVLRVTWRQITDQPEALAARLGAALAA